MSPLKSNSKFYYNNIKSHPEGVAFFVCDLRPVWGFALFEPAGCFGLRTNWNKTFWDNAGGIDIQ